MEDTGAVVTPQDEGEESLESQHNSADAGANEDGSGNSPSSASKARLFTPLPGTTPRASDLRDEGEEPRSSALPRDKQGKFTKAGAQPQGEEGKDGEEGKQAAQQPELDEDGQPKDPNKAAKTPDEAADPFKAPLPKPIKSFGREFRTLAEYQAYAEDRVNVSRNAQRNADRAAQEKIDRMQNEMNTRFAELTARLGQAPSNPQSDQLDPDEQAFWSDAVAELALADSIKDPAARARQQALVMYATATKIAQSQIAQLEKRVEERLKPHEEQATVNRERATAISAFEKIATHAQEDGTPTFPELRNQEDAAAIVDIWRQYKEAGVPDVVLYHPSQIGMLVLAYRAYKAGLAPKPGPVTPQPAMPRPTPPAPKSPSTPRPAVTGGAFHSPSLSRGNGLPGGQILPGIHYR